MPEEAAANQEEQKPIDVNTDKTKPVIMTLIVLAVLVMVLTPVITIVMVRTLQGAPEEKKVEDAPKTTEIALGAFTVNIAETSGTRYAKLDIVVEISNPAMAKYFEAKAVDKPEGMLNQIKAVIVTIVSDKNLAGLLSKEAKTLLAKEIKQQLNDLLQKQKDGVVTDVYFPTFLVQ
ncbi:MAG: hypothetical protein A2X49_05060 [Lentisphaerae bacterium GWF2_52_8]|nr:MAG: hypothetical protein A2X49_05060 [Lentisphaerae bacterium GWF2_52_8]